MWGWSKGKVKQVVKGGVLVRFAKRHQDMVAMGVRSDGGMGPGIRTIGIKRFIP